ncbi:hypothetical protein ABNQ39_00295 (plasmid) [Azospirillum sp. A26]|uniref:hypothetical protein n=1 Tax=Azospirillum sp. A26 TaxID=3160607 RepID=UPI00366CF9BC
MAIKGIRHVERPRAVAVDQLPSTAPAGTMVKLFPGEDFETAIRRLWTEARDRWVAIGELLMAWRGTAPHGEFMRMVDERMPFKHPTANKLMALATAAERDPEFVQLLPPEYTVAYEILTLSDTERAAAADAGLIRPDVKRAELVAFKRRLRSPSPPPPSDKRAELVARRARLLAELDEVDRELAALG